jgi:hypothetical protein
MNFWRAHTLWLGMLTVALIILTASGPALRLAHEAAQNHLSAMQTERKNAEQRLRQIEADMAAMQKLQAEMTESRVEKFLAPVNRLGLAEKLRQHGEHSHLSHFTASLAPERTEIVVTTDAGTQKLASSMLTLTADAATDTDIYAFMARLPYLLPGRVRIQQLTLERKQADDHTPFNDANIHVGITCAWLSNGSAPEIATR